jgi:hypothetical protein
MFSVRYERASLLRYAYLAFFVTFIVGILSTWRMVTSWQQGCHCVRIVTFLLNALTLLLRSINAMAFLPDCTMYMADTVV